MVTNPYFGISDGSPDVYTLRSTPITFEEKEFSLFKAAKDIWEKIRILKDFLSQNGEVDSDEFASMVKYFSSKAQFLDAKGEALVSFLILDNLINRKGLSIAAETRSFTEFYKALSNVEQFFQDIQDTEVKRSFIENVRESDENWQDIVISLYPYYTCSFMEKMISEGPKKNAIYKILARSIDNYKEDPDFFLYLEKSFTTKEWAKAKVTADDLLKTRINLLAHVNKRIANSNDVAENKKRQKQLVATLFAKDNLIAEYLKSADASQAQLIYSMLRGIPDLENERLSVKNQIANLFLVEQPDGFRHTDRGKDDFMQKRRFRIPLGPSLIHPDDDVPKRLMVLVQDQNRIADTGDCDGDYIFKTVAGILLLEKASCFAESVIVEIRLLLCAATDIGRQTWPFVFDLGGKNSVSVLVDEQSSHALRA